MEKMEVIMEVEKEIKAMKISIDLDNKRIQELFEICEIEDKTPEEVLEELIYKKLLSIFVLDVKKDDIPF